MAPSRPPPPRVVRAVERIRDGLLRLRRRSAPGPAVLLELILGAWVSQGIAVAAELKIADALSGGPLPILELARRVDAHPDALDRLMRALVSQGVFTAKRGSRYALNAVSEPLRSDAPVSIAGMARFVGAPQHREHWSHLAEAVRTGRPMLAQLRGMPAFEYLGTEPELAAIFNDAMTSMSELALGPVLAAYDFTRFSTIVDVGGGHGRLLSAILAAAPAAQGILYDLPEVVQDAPDLLSRFGVADRVQVRGGSFFEAVPPEGDAYVLKNVIHDWADEDAVRILRTVRAAARPGATVLLLETVIPDHHREAVSKVIDLEMLVSAGGQERTEREFRALFGQSGFRFTRVVQTAGPLCVIEGQAV
ncbi:methyltransferase [Mycobacterium sp. AMU20-3851]|uniref:methyltransferase n=1 Tax=Mycobacterium sp. AMU20-3851 TaxID=3122055 RepID=UPI0037549851